MKRFFATLLTLAFALGMILTPAWAQEATDAPLTTAGLLTNTVTAPIMETKVIYDSYDQNGDSYYRDSYYNGYNEGYKIGWQEGFDDSERDLASGANFAPKYHYDVFTQEETGWETYDDGYQNGLKDGYWRGYYDNYYQDVYDAAYAEGLAIGTADVKAGSYGNEPPYPGDDGQDIDYKRQGGLYDGYWQGYWNGWEIAWEAEMKAGREAHVTDLGGTPGQINVRLNESMIPFSGAYPEFQNGYTMVPVRALMETIAAEVAWQEETKTVTVTTDDILLTITVGSSTASLTVDGKTKSLPLDAPAYQKNNVTYVPLRLISEVLGYDISWDDCHKTAVLLDKDAIIAGIDENFTIYNKFYQMHKIDLNTRKQLSDRIDLRIELIDTIDGNRSFSFPANLDVKLGDGGLTAEGYLDLSKLKTAIETYVKDTDDSYMASWIGILSQKQEFACKLTPEGVLYIKCPLMDQLIAYNSMEGTPVATNSWYSLDLNQVYPDWKDVFELDTIGEMVWWATASFNSYGDPIDYYDVIAASATAYQSMLSDAAFTKSGSEYRLKFGLEDLINMSVASLGQADEYAEDMVSSLRETFSAFNLDMRLRTDGSYTLSANIKMQVDYLGSVFSMEQKGSGTVSGGEQSLLVQLKNVFNLKLTETMSIQTRNTAPDFSLPKGAKVIDLLGSGENTLEPIPEPAAIAEYAARALIQLQDAQF